MSRLHPTNFDNFRALAKFWEERREKRKDMSEKTEKKTDWAEGLSSAAWAMATAAIFVALIIAFGWAPGCESCANDFFGTAEDWEDCRETCYEAPDSDRELCLERCYKVYGEEKE